LRDHIWSVGQEIPFTLWKLEVRNYVHMNPSMVPPLGHSLPTYTFMTHFQYYHPLYALTSVCSVSHRQFIHISLRYHAQEHAVTAPPTPHSIVIDLIIPLIFGSKQKS
jgi:hypothetical protein